ncbi:hypothetical protein, partial [Bacillus sp. JJ722]|uniref:hypothetical protein n=1 Tax=Bacillus sp. JJ722 TaxID=3122973 RepID=UPI002FFDF151
MKRKKVAIGAAALLSVGIIYGGINFFDNTKEVKVAASNITLSDKEEIHYKMMNAIDFYNTAQGSFTIKNYKDNTQSTIDYIVDVTDNPSASVKVFDNQNPIQQVDFENNELTVSSFKKKTKSKNKTTPIKDIKKNAKVTVESDTLTNKESSEPKIKKDHYTQDIKERYYTGPNGEKSYNYRSESIMTGRASESIFPQEIATVFLEDYNNWNISNNYVVSKRNSTVLKGQLNDYYATKLGATNFELYVDKKTGILLMYK